MTPKVFTLRRETCEEAGCLRQGKHSVRRHFVIVEPSGDEFCPNHFRRITGLSLPVGGSLRVKLVPVRGEKEEMSKGQHAQANKHPKSSRGGRLASKLGKEQLALGRLEQLFCRAVRPVRTIQ